MKDYEERYKRIVNSEWFKKIYHDKSLGECPVEIPELEESEEEKIRQFLINEVSETSDEIMAYRNMDKNSVLNWLNSHKNKVQPQPKQEWSEEDEKMLEDCIGAVAAADYYTYEDKQNMEKWLKSFKNKVVPQEKVKWGENDEMGLCDALWAIEKARTIAENENDMGNLWYAERWLNSLKGRVQPQQKQEWSEEDESFMLRAIAVIGWAGSCNNRIINTDGASELQSWLKSLKPHPHWKPTKQNISDLEWCLSVFKENMGTEFNRLKVFVDELKKLM